MELNAEIKFKISKKVVWKFVQVFQDFKFENQKYNESRFVRESI